MDPWRGLFSAFRRAHWQTQYAPYRTAVTYDVTVAGLVYATSVLLVCVVIAVIGKRKGQKLFSFIRAVTAVIVLGAIMVCNYGQCWEVASVTTRTPYRTGTSTQIKAMVRVQIGLRSVNITLRGVPPVQRTSSSSTEQIEYNERFSWDGGGWQQGGHGIGHAAGGLGRDFRKAQLRGVPLPILWVAEYFTIDGEGLRWGRFYRQAGYFTHIALWLALPLWLLAVILVGLVPSYGAFYAILTGLDLVGACVLFSWIRNPWELRIPFEDGSLVFTWGWCYWLSLVTGVLCFLIGVAIYVADIHAPDQLTGLFCKDTTNVYEDCYISDVKLTNLADGDDHDRGLQGRITSMEVSHPSPHLYVNGGSRSSVDSRISPQLSQDLPLSLPAMERCPALESNGVYDELVTVSTECRRVFRKRSRGVLTLLKRTTRLRHRLNKSKSRIQPHFQSAPDAQRDSAKRMPFTITGANADKCGLVPETQSPANSLLNSTNSGSPRGSAISTTCYSSNDTTLSHSCEMSHEPEVYL